MEETLGWVDDGKWDHHTLVFPLNHETNIKDKMAKWNKPRRIQLKSRVDLLRVLPYWGNKQTKVKIWNSSRKGLWVNTPGTRSCCAPGEGLGDAGNVSFPHLDAGYKGDHFVKFTKVYAHDFWNFAYDITHKWIIYKEIFKYKMYKDFRVLVLSREGRNIPNWPWGFKCINIFFKICLTHIMAKKEKWHVLNQDFVYTNRCF